MAVKQGYRYFLLANDGNGELVKQGLVCDIVYSSEKRINDLSHKCRVLITNNTLLVDTSSCEESVTYKVLGFASAKIIKEEGGESIELGNCSKENALSMIESGLYSNSYNEKELLNIGYFNI